MFVDGAPLLDVPASCIQVALLRRLGEVGPGALFLTLPLRSSKLIAVLKQSAAFLHTNQMAALAGSLEHASSTKKFTPDSYRSESGMLN